MNLNTIVEVKRPASADETGAKSQGECAINPVAPAIANALANATGVRFPHLPFTPDRIFGKLAEQP